MQRCIARRVSRSMVLTLVVSTVALAQTKPRESDLKLPIGGTPGKLDAITDVAGVEVGYATMITGNGPLIVGQGPVRTGVTVVHPRGNDNADPVFASWFTLNGNVEMTGTTWVQESGYLEGPIGITNMHSVGVVRDAIIRWEVTRKNVSQPTRRSCRINSNVLRPASRSASADRADSGATAPATSSSRSPRPIRSPGLPTA